MADTISINTKIIAVTEYTNFNFNSYAKFNGRYIAANLTGIFELGGADDNGANIDSSLKTGTVDIYNGNVNRLRDAYVTFSSDGDIKLITVGNETTSRPYLKTNAVVSKIHERRIVFERGIDDRFFSFELLNSGGSTFDINSLRVALGPVRKRR